MPVPAALPLFLLVLPLARQRARTGRAGEGKVRSSREDLRSLGATDALLEQLDEGGLDLLDSLGVAYVYGAGTPASPWPGGSTSRLAPPELADRRGWDCAGHHQACLVRLGRLDRDAPDRGSAAFSLLGSPVEVGAQRLGDGAFYGTPVSHVMTVLTPPDAQGRSWVIGASGGTSRTFGQVSSARVKVFHTHLYRRDFRFFRRFP